MITQGTDADKKRWHEEDRAETETRAKRMSGDYMLNVGKSSLITQQGGMREVAQDAEYDRKHPVEYAHEMTRQRRQSNTAKKFKGSR